MSLWLGRRGEHGQMGGQAGAVMELWDRGDRDTYQPGAAETGLSEGSEIRWKGKDKKEESDFEWGSETRKPLPKDSMVLAPTGYKIRRSQNIFVNEESSLSQSVSIEVPQ